MEGKHTKGIWEVRTFNSDKIIFRHAIHCNGTNICKIMRDDNDNSEEEQANAKLIASAPDLLEALVEIIKTCNPENVQANKKYMGLDLGEFYVGGCGIPSDKAIHMAINAIEKATK
jgi:hypothetical protein